MTDESKDNVEQPIEEEIEQQAPQPKSRRKGLIWALVAVVVVIVALVVAAVVALAMWSSSPQKVLSDALKNAVSVPAIYTTKLDAKNTVSFQSGDGIYKLNADFDGTKLEAIATPATLYVKASDMNKVVSLATGGKESSQVSSFIKPLFSKFEGKWVSIDFKTSMLQTKETNKLSCVVDSLNALVKDNANREKLASVYVNNQFVDVTDQSKSPDELVYDLSVNRDKLVGFVDGFMQTSFYSSLKSCTKVTDGVYTVPEKVSGSARVALTSDHKFKKITINPATAKGSPVVVDVSYDGLKPLTEPADAQSLDDLFGGIIGTVMQGGATGLPQTKQ